MLSHSLIEPPTQGSLADARRVLAMQKKSVSELNEAIHEAEAKLARIIEESRAAIGEMERRKADLERQVQRTMAYIAPIRRLPHELLKCIFEFIFEDYPCCAWILASICSLWRRLVLGMPRLWSKIRLVTRQDASADTIRLWLERSGHKVPLDIEIYLRTSPNDILSNSRSSRRRSVTPGLSVVQGWPTTASNVWADWTDGVAPPPDPLIDGGYLDGASGETETIMEAPTPHGPPLTSLPTLPIHFGSVPPLSTARSTTKSRTSMHWGHIAFYYLSEQMHRWERFMFRFEKQFMSIHALKSIAGDVPLLREFEVSCAEPGFYGDWTWLPSAKPNTPINMGKIQSITLQYVPFKWSSPIFRNLRSLSLRTLPTTHIALDRIMFIVSSNPQLESLTLHFASAHPAVLPLSLTTLNSLKSLTIGGHYLLTTLLDSLALPALESLSFDVDARDPIEDTLATLLARSGTPPLQHLSLSYILAAPGTALYYGGGALITSWHFLNDMDHLRSLQVGGAPLEPLVSVLGAPDEDPTLGERWVCPNLVSLAMKGCHAHGDGVPKLVQMVEARNPDGGATFNQGGVTPVRLKHLELHDCATLGVDVISWLKARVEEVSCTEPTYESSPRSPSLHYL